MAVGYQAGSNLTSGSNNIDIGNYNPLTFVSSDVAGESNIIRIGDGVTQMHTYLTGVIHGNGSGLTGITSTSLVSGLTLGGNTTFSGDLSLPATSGASAGVLNLGGSTFLHAYGTGGLTDGNTFVGSGAGNFTVIGPQNTGSGYQALSHDTNGYANTADGYQALMANTTGVDNTATGNGALTTNISGSYNTADGFGALYFNSTGANNTGSGFGALAQNTVASDNTASGYQAMYFNSTAGKNVALGSGALYTQSFNNGGSTWNSLNVAVGYQALYNNQPTTASNGIQNTAIGTNALYGNTVAKDNTASGYQALYSNTTAGQNTALGSGALFTQSFNNGGAAWNSQNVAVGYLALYSNQPTATNNGVHNTATGVIALNSNSIGTDNTANGYGALRSNSTAGQNVAIGSGALQNQSFDNGGTLWNSGNVAVGYQALNHNQPDLATDGTQNAALGTQALYSNTTGINNTASGSKALFSNTIGLGNTASGYQSLYSNTIGNSNTAMGVNSLYHNTGDRNVAQGVTALFNNNSGSDNTASGYQALNQNTTGTQNVAVGSGALMHLVDGSNNIGIGYGSGGNLTTGSSNNIDIGSSGVTGESNIIRIGDGSTQTNTYLTGLVHASAFVADPNSPFQNGFGTTGIGKYGAASNVTLQVSRFNSGDYTAIFATETGTPLVEIGGIYALYANRSTGIITRSDGGSSWDAPSDIRIKHDVFPVTGALDTLARIHPVRFHYNADFLAKRPGSADTERYGVVAQEFQKVFPDFVDADPDGMLSVRMDPIPFVTAAAVQELNAKVNEREARIEALEKENRALEQKDRTIEARLQALEARLGPASPQ